MPTYDYTCEKCRKRFARTETISQHSGSRPVCPKCKSRRVNRVFTSFYAKTIRKS